MMQPMVNIALRAAREGGKIIRRAIDRPDRLIIRDKGEEGPATNIDLKVEETIIRNLSETCPDHAFLGEESGLTGPEDAEHLWIIDPLDGTGNFIRGVPHLCISLACRVRGQVEHGVILDPLRHEEFSGSLGGGARLNGHRCRVQDKNGFAGSLLATNSSPLSKRTAHFRLMARASQNSASIHQTGSAALDLAYVAAGRYQGVWMTGLKLWDFAAGALLIREAGGRTSDLNGENSFWDTGNLVGGAPKCHRALLEETKSLFPADET